MKTTPEHITSLLPHQVLVIGTNEGGFHGAGVAGLACRGTAANTWRTDPWFQRAIQSPVGSPDRIGKWAVYGVAAGMQCGREGMSYGIVTITRPGAKRSVPLTRIAAQVDSLLYLAATWPAMEFLVTRIGCGLAGYGTREIRDACFAGRTIPPNVALPAEFQ